MNQRPDTTSVPGLRESLGVALLDGLALCALLYAAYVQASFALALPYFCSWCADLMRPLLTGDRWAHSTAAYERAAFVALAIFYKLLFEAWGGGTLGRHWAGQRLLDRDGRVLGFRRALSRWFRRPSTSALLRFRTSDDPRSVLRLTLLALGFVQLSALALMAGAGAF